MPIYRGFTLTCFIAGLISLDFGLAFSVAKKSVGPLDALDALDPWLVSEKMHYQNTVQVSAGLNLMIAKS